LRRIFIAALIVVLATVPLLNPVSALAPPLFSQTQRKALILSSLNGIAPLGYYSKVINYELARAGYLVTMLTDGAVTLDVLLTQLNNYDIVIWRTNDYNYRHTTYWYVGQITSSAAQQKYQNDFTQGWINGNAGILGVSLNFYSNHFTSGSLNNVKLFLLISSDSDSIAPWFINANAKAVVFCNGHVSLAFGLIDDLTGALLSYLAGGDTVYNSVWNLVSPFINMQPKDKLDTSYTPPFWFLGDSTLKIT
jgi:hypothetical protein